MKKKPASKSAFFNPRVLIALALCASGTFLALLAFALYPGGTAFAGPNQQQNQSDVPAIADSITALDGSQTEAPLSAPTDNSSEPVLESGTIGTAVGAQTDDPEAACSQINGGLNPQALTESGVAAPAGFFWSEVQHDVGNLTESNTSAGFSGYGGSFRLADNFTIAQPCVLNNVVLYSYQTGGPGTSPFTAYTLRIWNGAPPGGAVVFGDTTTNRLVSSVDSTYYRIFNTAVPPPGTMQGTTRKIWKNTVSIGTTLPAGTYWLDWDSTVTAAAVHFDPSKTIAGARSAAGDNALQFTVSTATWAAAIDTGNPATAPDVPQDFPFELNGIPVGGTPSPTPTATATVPPSPTPTPSPGACVWTAAPVYPAPVLDEPVVTVGSNMYAFAGVSNGAIVAASNKFNGATWTPIAPFPIAVEFPSAVTDGTNIYVMGGALTGTGTPQTTNYRYNVGADNYTLLAPFSTGTWNHAAIYLNGKIYKFCGTGPATASTNVLEIYDIAGNSWSLGAPYPMTESFVSAWTQGGFIYAAGGIDGATSVATLKTYRYDPVGNVWNDAAIADLPVTRWGAACAFYNGGGVLAGGYVNGVATANISNSVISWDIGTNTWSNQPNMLGERARMTGAVLSGCFHVVGGRSIASSAFVGTNDNQKLCCGPAGTPSATPTATATSTATIPPTPTPTPTPSPGICGTILYDQTSSPGTNATSSQNFEAANDAFDNQGADDFVVPAGPAWTVQRVNVGGVYFNGPGPAASFNVTFYADSATFPGAVVPGGTFTNRTYTQTGSVFSIDLGGSVMLSPGTYWVSVQAQMDFTPGGQWGWTDRTVQSNSGAVWQNPGGGFGVPTCVTYGRRGTATTSGGCGIDVGVPDQIFQIVGCMAPSTVSISGTAVYCSNPVPPPVANVTMTLTGTASGSTLTDAGGNYSFTGLPSGGNYAVTPTKAARVPGSPNINTVDVIATQRHFLGLGTPLSGCRLRAADVNNDTSVNTVDVIAIQRFFLGLFTGIANTGRYEFNPMNRTYTNTTTNQTAQNYDTLVFGDTAATFVEP